MRIPRRSFLHIFPAASVTLLLLSGVASAQDATGHAELPRFQQVGERLFRGAQPRIGGIRRLAELGIQTVINLRGASDHTRAEEAAARALGLNYFNVPLPTWGRPDDARVRHALEVIAAPESGLVFVHCKDGVDRTGMVIALYRIIHEAWKTNDALTEAEGRGMRRIQFWMRDYVVDYGRRLRGPGAESAAQPQVGDEDLGDRIGTGVRIAEREAFKARKIGGHVLQRAPGAISGFLGGIF